MNTADAIDEYLLTVGPYGGAQPWPEESAKCAELARMGPELVPELLDRTCAHLREFSKVLFGVSASGFGYQTVIKLHERASGVVFEMINAGGVGGTRDATRVAQFLLVALEDQADAGKRAVAAHMCCLNGIPKGPVTQPITKHFDYDVAPVQACCSLFIATDEGLPRALRQRASAMIEARIRDFPLTKQYYAGEAQGTTLLLYKAILLQVLPVEISAVLYGTSS